MSDPVPGDLPDQTQVKQLMKVLIITDRCVGAGMDLNSAGFDTPGLRHSFTPVVVDEISSLSCWTAIETTGESSTSHALQGAIHTTFIVRPAYQQSKGCARVLFLQYIVCEVCTVCIEYKNV